MNKKEILSCLKNNKKISDYELKIVDKNSRELFYVLHNLQINRAVKVETVQINVYVSDGKTTGSSIVTVTAADDVKSLNAKLNKAVSKAKAVHNKYYPLPAKSKNITDKYKSKGSLNDIANNVAEAVFKADVYKDGWINSTEIFVSEYKEEFINSRGINHSTNRFELQIECIPTWKAEKEEIELYKFYESNDIDYKQITKEIKEILNQAKERSMAKKLDEVKLPKKLKVLVKNDMLEEIVGYLANDLSYASKYMKQNHYNKKDVISNNKFDLTMKSYVKGCSASRKYDGNGITLSSKRLIKDGKVTGNYGDNKFGYYANEKKITGNLPVCVIDAKASSYKKQKHLIIESFSAPQLEENLGYWGGEVRLARYFDGKKYIPITGFSISGSLFDDLKTVEFSKEENITERYKGPKYFIFNNVKIS